MHPRRLELRLLLSKLHFRCRKYNFGPSQSGLNRMFQQSYHRTQSSPRILDARFLMFQQSADWFSYLASNSVVGAHEIKGRDFAARMSAREETPTTERWITPKVAHIRGANKRTATTTHAPVIWEIGPTVNLNSQRKKQN